MPALDPLLNKMVRERTGWEVWEVSELNRSITLYKEVRVRNRKRIIKKVIKLTKKDLKLLSDVAVALYVGEISVEKAVKLIEPIVEKIAKKLEKSLEKNRKGRR